MARRSPKITVEITEGALRLHHAGRVLTLRQQPHNPFEIEEDRCDFVVLLDEIGFWDAPHDDVEIDIHELQRILEAIEDECERHGLTVEFD